MPQYKHLSIFLSNFLSIYLSFYISFNLSIYLSISIHPSAYLCIYSSVYISIYLSIYQSTWVSYLARWRLRRRWRPTSSRCTAGPWTRTQIGSRAPVQNMIVQQNIISLHCAVMATWSLHINELVHIVLLFLLMKVHS